MFWGSNYARLEAIKKKVDPTNVLWCSPCIGADMLTYDDERLCKNPKYPQAGPAPQTYPDAKSKAGIASLPGVPGITNPLLPIIKEYLATGKLPEEMPEFDDDFNILPPDHDHGGGGDDHDHNGGNDHDDGGGDHDHGEGPSTAISSSVTSVKVPAPSSIGQTSTPMLTVKPTSAKTTSTAGHDHGTPSTTNRPPTTTAGKQIPSS